MFPKSEIHWWSVPLCWLRVHRTHQKKHSKNKRYKSLISTSHEFEFNILKIKKVHFNFDGKNEGFRFVCNHMWFERKEEPG
jgi:hypothetical protein